MSNTESSTIVKSDPVASGVSATATNMLDLLLLFATDMITVIFYYGVTSNYVLSSLIMQYF